MIRNGTRTRGERQRVNRLVGAVAALVAAAAVAGCSTAVPGEAAANPAAKAAHVECVRATNDGVGAIKSYLAGVDAFTAPQLDTAPLRAMRAACNNEFVPAFSDFLVRIRTEFTPVSAMGRIGQRQFMLEFCRNNTVVGVKVDELTQAAQEACRDT